MPPALSASTIPAVIDAIVAIANASTVLQAQKVQVSDGFPGPNQPNDIFAVGGITMPTEAGTDGFATIGSQRVEEDYEVVCVASCYRGGGIEAQKPTRDAAFAIYNDICQGVRTSWNPGPNAGTLSTLNVHYICVSAIELRQTDNNDAAEGRTAEITFHLRVRARL